MIVGLELRGEHRLEVSGFGRTEMPKISFSASSAIASKLPKLADAKLVGEDTFKNDDASIAAQITRIKSLPEEPDAIMLCTMMPGAVSAVKQIRAAGIKAPILNGSGMSGSYWLSAVPDLSNFFVPDQGFYSLLRGANAAFVLSLTQIQAPDVIPGGHDEAAHEAHDGDDDSLPEGEGHGGGGHEDREAEAEPRIQEVVEVRGGDDRGVQGGHAGGGRVDPAQAAGAGEVVRVHEPAEDDLRPGQEPLGGGAVGGRLEAHRGEAARQLFDQRTGQRPHPLVVAHVFDDGERHRRRECHFVRRRSTRPPAPGAAGAPRW